MIARSSGVLALALLACRSKSAPPSPMVTVDSDAAVGAAVEGFRIPSTTRALVTVVFADWNATHATMQLWTRGPDGWTIASDAWPTMLGSAGAAWGIGAHGVGAPRGHTGPVKREGDTRTPAGAFTIAGFYGYAATPYQQLTKDWKCIDDPASHSYNQILDATKISNDWNSAEEMRRDDDLYKLVVDVRHNPGATPNAGSCIFLHVWGGPDTPTVGCIAMTERKLAWLMSRLPPASEPRLVVLPRAAYDTLTASWGLPH